MTYKRLHLAKRCQVFQERATYGLVMVGKVELSLDFEKSAQMQRLGMGKSWTSGSGLIYSIIRRIQRFYCSIVNNTEKNAKWLANHYDLFIEKHIIQPYKKIKVPIKLVVKVNVVLKSTHNHIKITTKLQNNHHLEPSEI